MKDFAVLKALRKSWDMYSGLLVFIIMNKLFLVNIRNITIDMIQDLIRESLFMSSRGATLTN